MLGRVLETIEEFDEGVGGRLGLSLGALEGCISLENGALE
jgi:hypothetical protein